MKYILFNQISFFSIKYAKKKLQKFTNTRNVKTIVKIKLQSYKMLKQINEFDH
jgi:hypothetical protein